MKRIRVFVLACSAVAGALGCYANAETPADQYRTITDAVQTERQYDAHLVLTNGHFPNLGDAVSKAFGVASIQLDYHDTYDNLDPPQNPYYPDWPDANTNLGVYQAYAKANHDVQHYPWVIFYVKHEHTNNVTTCPQGATIEPGFSNYSPANVKQTDPTLRYTFIFVNDIQVWEQSVCPPFATDQQLESEMIHIVAHEYGHQRAGLTDYLWTQSPPGNSGYHQGTVLQGRQDVMARPPSYSELWGHLDPVFDALKQDAAGYTIDCVSNLLTNR